MWLDEEEAEEESLASMAAALASFPGGTSSSPVCFRFVDENNVGKMLMIIDDQ